MASNADSLAAAAISHEAAAGLVHETTHHTGWRQAQNRRAGRAGRARHLTSDRAFADKNAGCH